MPPMSRVERAWCRSPVWRALAQRVVLPWALQGARLHGEVLEVGGGSGAIAEALLERFPDISIVATDIDPVMVDSARRRLEAFGRRATVSQADATSLEFPDGRFDSVVSFIMLHHVIDWQAALAEVARVLRPGGRLVGYDLAASAPTRWLHQAQRHGQRMVAPVEMREQLQQLPFEDHAVAPALGGIAVRFRATRSSG